jgi:hypothetical protein
MQTPSLGPQRKATGKGAMICLLTLFIHQNAGHVPSLRCVIRRGFMPRSVDHGSSRGEQAGEHTLMETIVRGEEGLRLEAR